MRVISPLNGKRILLGVTGSIAAYKAAALSSDLTQQGALVDVILTPSAEKFITPLTFQAVTGRRAYTEKDLWQSTKQASGPQPPFGRPLPALRPTQDSLAGEPAYGGPAVPPSSVSGGPSGALRHTGDHILHINLAQNADLMVIAPATADTIARLAHGFANDLLTLTALCLPAPGKALTLIPTPLIIAPAMDAGMYDHPAVQANLKLLRERGALEITPELGRLASGLAGQGRMAEPDIIAGKLRFILSRQGPLRGRRIIVTAGPTQEPIDPVRFISNRSSGKQGFALAQAALDAGAETTLITGPCALPTPEGLHRINVGDSQKMASAVLRECPGADALIMAAAVADFRPETQRARKIKKNGKSVLSLNLGATTDILKAVSARQERPRVVVGFAAETNNLIANARLKLGQKKLSLIAANDVTKPDSGFDGDTNSVTLIEPGRDPVKLGPLHKAEVATAILNRVASLLEE